MWNLINKTNKQNVTSDIEIKSRLTVTTGEVGGDNGGGKGERVFRNMYEGNMDKTKEERIKGEKWGWLGWGWE